MTQRVALGKEYEAAKDDDASKAVIDKMQLLQSEVESKQAAVGKKIKDLADQTEPGDAALEMFVWLIRNVRSDEEIRSFAMDNRYKKPGNERNRIAYFIWFVIKQNDGKNCHQSGKTKWFFTNTFW